MPGRGGPDRAAARKARLERHAGETDADVVLNAAARFLEARSRSVHEVRHQLTQAAYPPALVDRAVARLLELGMLDDEAFARGWVESRDRAHPRGRQVLRRELSLKGIDRVTIEAVLEEREASSVNEPVNELAAERLLAKRAATLLRVADARLRRQRAYVLLARNGFDADVCREVSTRFVSGHSAAEGDTDPDG